MNNKGIKVFSGNSNPDLAKRIAMHLGQPLAKCQVGKFSNGETMVMIGESSNSLRSNSILSRI